MIAIIAILASMLLPALSKARAAAQSIKCVSNLKSSALMLTLYINDNEGRIIWYNSNSNFNGWSLTLYTAGYNNSTKAFECPTANVYPGGSWHTTYGINCGSGQDGHSEGVIVNHMPLATFENGGTINLWSNLLRPALPILGDTYGYGPDAVTQTRLISRFGTKHGNNTWGLLTPYHNNRINMALLDGSAGSFLPKAAATQFANGFDGASKALTYHTGSVWVTVNAD